MALARKVILITFDNTLSIHQKYNDNVNDDDATHVQYCRTDTDRYLQLTVRKFRTDRHSCLRTVICG